MNGSPTDFDDLAAVPRPLVLGGTPGGKAGTLATTGSGGGAGYELRVWRDGPKVTRYNG
jgi:hypothetical protein